MHAGGGNGAAVGVATVDEDRKFLVVDEDRQVLAVGGLGEFFWGGVGGGEMVKERMKGLVGG